MSYRPRLIVILSLLVLLSLTVSACSRERPVTNTSTTPAARGTVAAPAPGGTGTQGAATAASGAAESAPTPSAPSPQQVVVSPSASSSGGTGTTTTYTVVAGDTLQTIAARFGTTPQAIAQLNSLADPNTLTLGQKLQIPAGGAAGQGAAASSGSAAGASATDTRSAGQASSGGTSTYTVQAGDNLGKIAQRFGTTVAELKRLNNLANPDVLKLGQQLIVPGSGGGTSGAAVTAPSSGQSKTYVIQKGDTLLSIARRFGLTVKQLQAANNITNPDRIAVGQKLTIP